MPQRTRRNTIGRRSTRVHMTCRTFPLWLERQSSPSSLFVRFSCQFSSVICAFSSENIFFKLFCYIILAMSRQNRVRMLDGNFAPGRGHVTDYPQIHIFQCMLEQTDVGSRTNYVLSTIPHCSFNLVFWDRSLELNTLTFGRRNYFFNF